LLVFVFQSAFCHPKSAIVYASYPSPKILRRKYYMSKQEDAELILKLYDLRREETMRKARTWLAGFRSGREQRIFAHGDVLLGHGGVARQ
jgi:hypothetical protein